MATIDNLITQFETDLGNDVKNIRTALSNKGASSTSSTKLSGVANKINSIPISYYGTITVNYPTSWNSGYIYYKKQGTSGAASSVVCNGSGRATITVYSAGTYVITNSHQASDSTTVTFYAT